MRAPSTILGVSVSLCLAMTAFVGCKKTPTDPPDSTTGEPADSGDDGAADTGADEGGVDTGADPAELAWADMDRSKRLEYMGTVVLPKMKAAWGDKGDLKCANCHGADYKEVDFKMPNDLTPLDPADPIKSGMAMDEETAKFMVDTVMPTMGELLGMQVDMTTGKGEFGCLSCHLSE